MKAHLTSIALAAVLVTASLAASAAQQPSAGSDAVATGSLIAKRGADDAAGDDRGGRGRGKDDGANHARRGRGADDGAGHQRRGRGQDDGPNHT